MFVLFGWFLRILGAWIDFGGNVYSNNHGLRFLKGAVTVGNYLTAAATFEIELQGNVRTSPSKHLFIQGIRVFGEGYSF